MRELFNRIWTRPRYGAGFLLVLFFGWLFFWRLFNPESFTENMNGFWRDVNTLFWYLIKLVLVIIGLAVMCGWRPFKKKNTGSGHK